MTNRNGDVTNLSSFDPWIFLGLASMPPLLGYPTGFFCWAFPGFPGFPSHLRGELLLKTSWVGSASYGYGHGSRAVDTPDDMIVYLTIYEKLVGSN
jgi:hypothetical protein